MTDTSILDKAVHDAPKQYTVSGAQDIIVKSITASFDGSGAAGSYVPAVQILDPAGFVVGTYTLGQTLAAGASADVSWFPGVVPTVSSNPVVSNQLDYVEILAAVTILPANNSGNQKTIIASNPLVFDGLTRIRIEVFASAFDIEGSFNFIADMWDNGTDLGRMAQLDLDPNPTDLGVPFYSAIYRTPTAGTHTFRLKGWSASGVGQSFFQAGPGGLLPGPDPNYLPAWMRIST